MDNTSCKKPCSKCECSRVEPDPDPFDWFCDDDEKIYCKKLEKYVAGAMRPYETDKFVCSSCPMQ